MLRLAIILLCLPFAVFAKYDLAICAIFQNDAPFLKEWIEFHKLQGVGHFYLYSNNSEDNYVEVLNPYVESGDVTLIQWDYTFPPGDGHKWNFIQCSAYMDCIANFGNRCRWMAFIDTDEFIFCTDGMPLPIFLKPYRQYGGIGANWQMFGTSGVWDIPDGDLMIRHLIRCSLKDDTANRHVKPIVQPRYVSKIDNPHYLYFTENHYLVDENMKRINGPKSDKVNIDKIRINHYWTRTEKYFLEYKVGKRVAIFNDDPNVLKAVNDSYNLSESDAILQFVPDLLKQISD